MRYGLPKAAVGQAIGLLGGSFDPPHEGHLHISRAAMARFGLSRVWWLVSPGNPLKKQGPAPLEKRMAACHAIARDPRITVTDFEAKIGTRYTAETLEALFQTYPGVNFVWLMGADNLASFHKWERWEWIMENIPVGVIARPDNGIAGRLSPAARRFRRFQLRGSEARLLPHVDVPAWCFANVPMVDISSTEIRQRGGWTR